MSCEEEKKARLEALLFVSGEPLTVKALSAALQVEPEEVRVLAEALRQTYAERRAGLTVAVREDKVQMTTSVAVARTVENFLQSDKEGDLSRSALETISVIAYRGPVTRAEIEEIRGVNCSFAVRSLLIRGLIERSSHPHDARTFVYSVSMDFLRYMGLEKIQDLPRYAELREKEPAGQNVEAEEKIEAGLQEENKNK